MLLTLYFDRSMDRFIKLFFLGTDNRSHFGRNNISIKTKQYTKFYRESTGRDQK